MNWYILVLKGVLRKVFVPFTLVLDQSCNSSFEFASCNEGIWHDNAPTASEKLAQERDHDQMQQLRVRGFGRVFR